MDAAEKTEYSKTLLSLIPESGSNIGNVTLREKLKEAIRKSGAATNVTDQDYWLLRDSLIDEGHIEQGRGRGGSVHRIIVSEEVHTADAPFESGLAVVDQIEAVTEKLLERDLYEPFLKAITEGYVKENRIKRFVSEITAAQGRRATGGKWTRPDVIIAAVRSYHFTPGKRLEVITFEVKPNLATAFEGVYESLAHSVFAHRSYLAVNVSGYKEDEKLPDERIVQECDRHGVGYITFEDPANYGTYEIVVGAKLREPDPFEVDNFIRKQLNAENQDQLREFLQ